MRTTMITFAGHTYNVRSDAEEPFDITALDMFKAELERLKKADAIGDLADPTVGGYSLVAQHPAVARAHLRDEFAKVALNALLGATANAVTAAGSGDGAPTPALLARSSYVYADAMLAERDKTKPDAP